MPSILPRQAFTKGGIPFPHRERLPSQKLLASRPALRLPAAVAQGVAALKLTLGIIFSPRTRSK